MTVRVRQDVNLLNDLLKRATGNPGVSLEWLSGEVSLFSLEWLFSFESFFNNLPALYPGVGECVLKYFCPLLLIPLWLGAISPYVFMTYNPLNLLPGVVQFYIVNRYCHSKSCCSWLFQKHALQQSLFKTTKSRMLCLLYKWQVSIHSLHCWNNTGKRW